MKNKIGLAASTYMHHTVEEALESVSKIGIKYIELFTIPGFMDQVSLNPEDANDTLNLCKKYGVELNAVGGHFRMLKEDSVESFKQVIDIANLLGVDYVDTDSGEMKNENDKDVFYKDMRILADYAASKGITIGIETHGNWNNNGKIQAETVKKIDKPNVKITYDPANAIFYGDTNPEGDMEYAIPFLGHFHIKDKRGGKGVWDFPPLGEGELDFDKMFDLLKDFEGPMSIEMELDGKEHPLDEVNIGIKTSYEFLKGYGLV